MYRIRSDKILFNVGLDLNNKHYTINRHDTDETEWDEMNGMTVTTKQMSDII